MSVDFRTTVDIHAAPGLVWDVMLDVERWPEWDPVVTSVQRLDSGPFAAGSRAKVFQPKLRPAEWRVSEFDAKTRSFVWITRTPGLQIAGGHRVEQIQGGARVTLTLTLTGVLSPLIAWLYGGLNRRYIAAEADGLRRRCEKA